MKEVLRGVDLSENAALYVICLSCLQVLYEPELDNGVTRNVAQLTADSHSKAFSKSHRVFVFNGPPSVELYDTECPEPLVQEQRPMSRSRLF